MRGQQSERAADPRADVQHRCADLTGPDSTLPVTLMTPLSACRIRSNPPRAACGPMSPYPEIDP